MDRKAEDRTRFSENWISPRFLYDHWVHQVTGFILAGGKSSRMGRDKSFLLLAGQTLLERAILLVRSITPEVRIVGSATKFAPFGPVTTDIFLERGPLGGIHAALADSSTDFNLVIAVDLPFIEGRFLSYLLAEALKSQAVVTVPRLEEKFQPLCAVYRKAFLTPAGLSLSQGKNKVDAIFSEVSLRVINQHELHTAGYKCRMFSNLNTPEDWQWAERECESQSTPNYGR